MVFRCLPIVAGFPDERIPVVMVFTDEFNKAVYHFIEFA